MTFTEQQKRTARRKTTQAIRRGEIRSSLYCEKCGKGGAECHHDDYSNPLAVRFLCTSCRQKYHRALKRAANHPAVQRAIEQAKYQTDRVWAAKLIDEALRAPT